MKWHLRSVLALSALAIVTSVSATVVQLNSTGIKVVAMSARNDGFTSTGQYFTMYLGNSVTFTCGAVTSHIEVAVPRLNPLGGATDNPAYRDYHNLAALALTLNRDVWLYADGCIDGHPRVVGMSMM